MERQEFPITVCMPMYNAARYLRECIESVLAQTFADFEFLIVDDGSDDNSIGIAESYADPRIRLIRNRHDYIASLNLLLREARGKYIARMDADDVMTENRLQIQYDYMEAHPDVDVWVGALSMLGEKASVIEHTVTDEPLTLQSFTGQIFLGNTASMMRAARVSELGIGYEETYKYAEDFRFWSRMVCAGARIVCTNSVFSYYRTNPTQTSAIHNRELWDANMRARQEVDRWISDKYWKQYRKPEIRPSTNKLTVIIPFLNEGIEVANTVRSIRATVGNSVDIIVINDQSTDDYAYEPELRDYQVYYWLNQRRLGVARSRDLGVSLCRTPYFLLLDGHMRFYDGNWCECIVRHLSDDDRRVLCAQTKCLKKEDGEVKEGSDTPAFGAYMPLHKEQCWPDIAWNHKERKKNYDIEEIGFVLGAGYAASKRYWLHLRGLSGLIHYGSDEAYLSMKVWLEGGSCLLLKNVVIGHIYRQKAPYQMFGARRTYNNLMISQLLFPQSMRELSFALSACLCPEDHYLALGILEQEKESLSELKKYYDGLFTKHYKEIAHLLHVRQPEIDTYVESVKWTLPLVRKHICGKTCGLGLYEGKMAALIWLYHYARFDKSENLYSELQTLWELIENGIESKSLCPNFRYGLSGIGWGILYLSEQGFDVGRVDRLLAAIDKGISLLNIHRMEDYSLDTGVTGVLCYVTARLRNAGHALPADFLQELYDVAQIIKQNVREVTPLFYARLFADIMENGTDEHDIPVTWGQWMTFPQNVARNATYWRYSIPNGIIGASLIALI